MNYQQAILGGLVTVVLSILVVGLARQPQAQAPAGYVLSPSGDPRSAWRLNTGNGQISLCRGVFSSPDNIPTGVNCSPFGP
jgi:hypothetical protein